MVLVFSVLHVFIVFALRAARAGKGLRRYIACLKPAINLLEACPGRGVIRCVTRDI